eukprot:2084998-Rhodomonas_salina.1
MSSHSTWYPGINTRVPEDDLKPASRTRVGGENGGALTSMQPYTVHSNTPGSAGARASVYGTPKYGYQAPPPPAYNPFGHYNRIVWHNLVQTCLATSANLHPGIAPISANAHRFTVTRTLAEGYKRILKSVPTSRKQL